MESGQLAMLYLPELNACGSMPFKSITRTRIRLTPRMSCKPMRASRPAGIHSWMIRRIRLPMRSGSCFIPPIRAAVHDKHQTFMKNHTIALLSLLWIGISANSFGQGTILVQHSGSADPTTEGFSLNIGPGITVGPVTNDLGMDAWRTTATSGGIGLFGYQQLLTPQQQTQVTGSDWMMSVTLRIVQSSDTIQHIFAGFNTGSQGFGLGFGLNGNGDPFVEVDESSLSPIYTLAGAGSSYNNYELIYNSANNLASLWVDGVDEINNISGIQTSSS